MRKTIVIITSCIVTFGIILTIYVAWPWIFLSAGLNSLPNPSQPSITYAEFPFRLKYELNEKEIVIEDVLICEFDGFGTDEGRGKYRKWKQRLASGNENIRLLKLDDNKEIEFVPGSAGYYMGDPNDNENDNSFPNAIIISKDGRFITESGISSEQLLEQYNIKLLSWDISHPITNEFSE